MYSSVHMCLTSYNSTQSIKAAKEKYPASYYTQITPQLEATKHLNIVILTISVCSQQTYIQNFMFLIQCMCLQSIYSPTHAVCNITHITHIKNPTCLGTQVSSAGSCYNIGVRADLLLYIKPITMNKT